VIEPRCTDLAWARGIAVTEVGPVAMSWSKSPDGRLTIDCTIPQNATATLRLYRQGTEENITLDGQARKARVNGKFIEETLASGAHTIHCPS
jgi:hypothetical protein